MAGAPRQSTKVRGCRPGPPVHRVAPSVAIHIPWDLVADWSAMAQRAKDLGVAIGAVNPNVFQAGIYQHGSLANADPSARAQAVAHLKECVGIMRATGSKHLSLWFADGTNFPGQAISESASSASRKAVARSLRPARRR